MSPLESDSGTETLVEEKTEWGTNVIKVRQNPFFLRGEQVLLYACERCGYVQAIKRDV